MADCESIKRQIDDYLDDRLDSAALRAFERHVAECSECQSTVINERSLIGNVSALGVLADRIAAAPVAPVELPSKRLGAWRVAAAIVVFAAIGLGAYQFGTRKFTRSKLTDNSGNHLDMPHEGVHSSTTIDLEKAYVTLEGGDDRLAVQVASDDPHVHVIWLYDVASNENGLQ